MQTETILYIILSGIIALLVALFQYGYKRKEKTRSNWILTFLRFLTVFAILLLIINPKLEKETFYNEKPNLVIAIDDSNSMAFLKQEDSIRQMVSNLKNNKELNDKFNLDFYTFSSDLKLTDSLSFTNNQTNIDYVFKGLSDIYKNSISPTILLSDGNQTLGSDYEYAASSYKQPIFPVVLGDTTAYADLKIQQLNVNKYAFHKNKFPVEVIVVYNGESAVNSVFKIISGNTTVWSKELNFSKANNSSVLNFTLPANSVGLYTYKALIEPMSNEKNTVNNAKNFAIEVIDEKTNIAIVSDFLHPDLGALKKSIESNEQRFVSLVTVNDYLNKSNDYQLVILYQPSNNFKPLLDELEKSNANKLVIAGTKTNWSFLNDNNTNYKHDLISQTENYQAIVNTNYTEFIIPNLDFESFPPLSSKFGTINFSNPYQTLLYKKVGNITTEDPLLATIENNNKREGILLGEDIWKWRAQSFINKKAFSDFDDFIGKIVQYLATKKRKERLSLDYESFYSGSTNVLIKAQYFNKNYEFDNREVLTISVKDMNNNETKTFPMVLKNNNYEVDLSSLSASDYSFTVKGETSNISKSGNFKILEYNIEQQFLNANVTKLQALAINSQGASYFGGSTTKLIEDLIADSRFATIEKSTKNTVPLIDWKYLLALIAFCLSAEWFLRKYKGLI